MKALRPSLPPPPAPEFEPATRIKTGAKLIPPHSCRMHLPEKELNGAIYQCPCGTYYRYYERGLLYFYRYDMVEGNSHWARCNEIGHLYLWTNVAPWWKTMWGITDYRHIITEEGGQTDD